MAFLNFQEIVGRLGDDFNNVQEVTFKLNNKSVLKALPSRFQPLILKQQGYTIAFQKLRFETIAIIGFITPESVTIYPLSLWIYKVRLFEGENICSSPVLAIKSSHKHCFCSLSLAKYFFEAF